MLRTTLNLARSLGELVSRLLAEALSESRGHSSGPDFLWTTTPMEAQVDLEDAEALHRLLDAPRA